MAKSSKSSKKGKGSKGKTKGSKDAAKSKSKGNGKKVVEETPPVDVAVQTCPNNFCYLCCFQLHDAAAIQSHVLLLSHASQNFGDTDLSHLCRLCHERIPLKWGPTHKCCSLKTSFISCNTSVPALKGGAPFQCLFCRGRPLKSRSDLVVHLLAFHRPGRPRGQCGLCDFHFEELPPSPLTTKIPPPSPNADLETVKQYRIALRDAELSELLKLESAELKLGEIELEKHCATDHNPVYRIVSREAVQEYTHLREPYACFLCHRIYKNNWDFHAHVLCRHGQKSELRGRLLICAMCGEASSSEEGFDKHVHTRHVLAPQCLADYWTRNELLQEYVCCATTCATCWEIYEEDFELQAHILVAHTAPRFLQCGWCNTDFSGGFEPLDRFLIFLNHEHNHARGLHAAALELRMTAKAMPPALPDDLSKEAVEAALRALGGGSGDDEVKSGKSKSKDKSKSKGSKDKAFKSKKNDSSKGGKSKGSKKKITFFWVTRLIILGYRKTLELSHLYILEEKHLSASIVPSFLRNICKYLHVDIANDLDTPHTSKPQFALSWPAQETSFPGSDEQKPATDNRLAESDAAANLNEGSTDVRISLSLGRRSTFAEVNPFSRTQVVGADGQESRRESQSDATGGKAKLQRPQRTMSSVPDIGKKTPISSSTSILPNIRIRFSGRPSKFKQPPSKKSSASGDLEVGLMGQDRFTSPNKSGATESPKAVKQEKRKVRAGLVKALFATFGWRVFIAGLFKLCHDICLLSGPIIFKRLLNFLQPESTEPMWHGYIYALLMFLTAFMQSLMLHQYFRKQTLVGMDMRTVVISAVYRKSLRLSAAARCESTTGEITNLMSIDAYRFFMLMVNLHIFWSGPLQVTVAIYLLWKELGPSVFTGVALLLVMIPINTMVAKKSKVLQEKQLKTTDKRIKLISEILNGIRVLKLYAWEPSFIQEVGSIREKELSYLRKFLYLDCSITFVFTCIPTLVALATFATYILSSPENVFTAEKAFVSLSLLNILRFPLFMFPTLLSNLVQAYVSVRRVTNFLVNTELDPVAVSHEDTPGVAAVIENGTLAWGPDSEPALQNVTAYFTEGQSTSIVGRVGCGKSSLLNALLGNMELISGRVNIKGRLALVSQQSWIFNATLRENILFHHPYDPERYAKIIKACALEPDIKLLPMGDLTDIGDKGVNLSGGQKLRVSLARACYADADVYLLDDPLAAVDTHVASHLLKHVLGRGGLLSGRTRIMATHNPSAIAASDRVAVLDSGRLVEYGSYSTLIRRPASHLNAFLRSEELRQRISEREAASESAAAAEVETSVVSSFRRRRTSTESHAGSYAPASDLAELTLMETEALDPEVTDDAEPLSSAQSRSSPIKEAQESNRKASRAYKSATIAKGEKTDGEPKGNLETSAIGRVKLVVFWMYIRNMGLGLFLGGVLFLFFTQIAWLGNNIWLADWSNDASKFVNNTGVSSNQTTVQPMKSVGLRLGVYAVIGMCQVAFNVSACMMLAVGSVRAVKVLHHQLLSCVLHVPTSFFDSVPQGRIMNRFSNEISTVDNHLMISMRSMLTTLFSCLITFALCALPSAYILILLACLLGFYATMQNLFVTTSRQLKRLDSVSKSPIFSHFAETLLGVDTIRAYGLCDLFVNTSDTRVDANNRALFGTLIANRWLSMVLETVGNLLTFSVSVAFVATRDTLAAGFAGLVISYTLNIIQGLSWFVRMSTEFETNVVSVEKIREYSKLTIEAPWEVPAKQPPAQWPQGEIEFINYSTRYRDDLDPVLRSISFTIKPGEKIGIVGRTGSGKSSLVLALFRIIEANEGEIRLDGQNIAEIGLHDLRGRITLIPQDPVLFSGTLRFNLDPFNTHTDKTVWEALTLANLRSFVEETSSDGLEMTIAEGGNNLSVGQRQLVCLARALLRRSRVLVLDEATAAVDPQTDQLIQHTVRKEFASSTVITIAHRLDTIIDYDRIMVLDAGRLIEMGPPKELAGRSGSLFRGMLLEANLLNTVLNSSQI
ncbi:multidrug resistance associated protein 1 [Echinococcus multilocularis]|uniref:Multidrug resistance associated protein 1 n=1 Tax=Echinococcus multilocularis TaxID=6211 RepID=A0A068Y1C8_ECHMU|nr:multidrug resistance associated protein 1 [Echinococcus multilocularis]